MSLSKNLLYLLFIIIECVLNIYCYTNSYAQDQYMNVRVAQETFRGDPAHSVDRSVLRRNQNSARDEDKLHYIPKTSSMAGNQFNTHINRTTQKQYEIINMLWRKTNIFINEKDNAYGTIVPPRSNKSHISQKKLGNKLIIYTTPSANSMSTTPSKIEFYYMEENLNDDPQKDCLMRDCQHSNKTRATLDKPLLVFHLKGPFLSPQSVKTNQLHINNSQLSKKRGTSTNQLHKVMIQTDVEDISSNKFKNKVMNQATSDLLNRAKSLVTFDKTQWKSYTNSTQRSVLDTESTTIYDKIKFFELYDRDTEKSYTYNTNKKSIGNKNNITMANNTKILYEHVDQSSHDHNLAKLFKKHIRESVQDSIKLPKANVGKENKKRKSTFILDVKPVKRNNVTNVSHRKNGNPTKSTPSNNITILTYVNGKVSWSDYPFVAVYIYEPSQVHCDAAGISSHWLVASGSCLSRVSKNPVSGGQSAFVAYCGEQWWQPERVAYVKYSLVHPSYNPRDRTRRHMFNIGVIQVVSSMASACSGWAPVSMISHMSVDSPGGTEALAIGWGLDRFDTRYGATELPKIPLMIYKGLVYFGSCPGNVGYSNALRLEDLSGVKNIHCLSLPPYTGEENDPVHGGLLLVGGKLIGLYLQEERRPWGQQSAQYTGIWQLIPWVMDVAKEQDEIDSLAFEL